MPVYTVILYARKIFEKKPQVLSKSDRHTGWGAPKKLSVPSECLKKATRTFSVLNVNM